jgi:L-rhamnose-H+ transport protein
MNESIVNPGLGTLIFVLGGLAGAVFYLPLKREKNWAWESYWMFYAIFALVVSPWLLAFAKCPKIIEVLKQAPSSELWYCYLCGAAWGFGGLTWGLMIRYLGVGLGLAIGCGICSAAGTLIPKVITGKFAELLQPGAGMVSLMGVAVSIVGIVLVGLAGMSKEGELPEEAKKKAVEEYDFKKGILVAIFSGFASAGLGFGLQGGGNMESLALQSGTAVAWKGMPVLVMCLLGGFTVNALWCLFLNMKNKTLGDYTKKDAPLVANIFFALCAGVLWVCQFVAFKTGEPRMGDQGYVGWAVLMASSIMFSGVLGLLLGEWKGTSAKTRGLLVGGLVILLGSAVIAGYSGKLGQQASAKAPVPVAVEKAIK